MPSGQHLVIHLIASVLPMCLVFTAASAADSRQAEEGGGFIPGQTLVGGPGGDFISPFSGDVETVIDIGPALQAGGGLKLGLSLQYSSKIWITASAFEPSAALKRRGAFGVGWKMHLGRVFQACHALNCSGPPKWVYESPDGAEHELFYPMDAAPDGQPDQFYMGTSDGTWIRAVALGPPPVWNPLADDPNQWSATPSGWRLYMGNGIVHTLERRLDQPGVDANHPLSGFGADYSDDFRGWYTTRIERWKATESGGAVTTSPVGQITVTYGTGTTAHCINSVEFRALPVDPNNPSLLTEQRRITFHNSTSLNGSPIEGGYTHQIDFPALHGSTTAIASYHFTYSGPHQLTFKPDPGLFPDLNRTSSPTEFLLTQIGYPINGYQQLFGYDLSETDDIAPAKVTGELVSRTLPTGAVIRYKYGTYTYSAYSAIASLREVNEKAVYLVDPSTITGDPNAYIGVPSWLDRVGFWILSRQRGGTMGHPLWSKIRDAFNNETVYEFPEDPGQAGRVFHYRGHAPNIYGGTISVAEARLVRTTRTTYVGSIPEHQWTILHDEQGKMVQTQRLNLGPFGQFGTIKEFDLQWEPTTSNGVLSEDVVPYRKTLNVYSTMPNDRNSARWQTWSVSQLTSQSLEDGLGTPKRKTVYQYESDGRIASQTSFVNPAAADPNATGNIKTEYRYDATNLNPERSFTRKIGESDHFGSRHEYHLSDVFPWKSYVLNPADPNGPTSQAFSYESIEVDTRDFASGFVKAYLDPSNVRTDFEYDLLGRPTRVDPDGSEAPTDTTYVSPVEVVTTRTDGTQVVQTRSLLDPLGRVKETRRRTESGTCEARQTTTYDIAGRATFVSEWGFDTATGCPPGLDPATEIYSSTRGTRFDYHRDAAYWGDTSAPNPSVLYDPLGRILRVQTADTNTTESRYTGLGTTVTINSVGTSPAGPVSTYYELDAFGRLSHVDAPEGADAYYFYALTGELTRVELHGFDPNTPTQPVVQARSFVYDQLGRLTSATNPESGTVLYTKYDAMGRVKEKIESDGTIFTYTYDAAGRNLTASAAPDPNTPAHQLAVHSYDPNISNGQSRLGKVESFDETGALLSRREFSYEGLNGRMSEDRITFGGWDGADGIGTLDKTFRTCFSSYDNLGQLTTMRYPAPETCDAFPGTVANLHYTYGNGVLIGVNDTSRSRTWITSKSYSPSGGVRRIVHGNGRATSVVPDVMGRPRAIGVLLNPSGADFDPNNMSAYVANTMFRTGLYSYDGSGNIVSIGPANPTDPNTIDTFVYDKLSRLKSASVHSDPNNIIQTYALGYNFDSFGNILSTTKTIQGVPQGAPVMSVSQATNRLLALNGVVSSYDPRGNLLRDDNRQYAYDERNRLLAAGDPATTFPTAQYSYDSGGERIIKSQPRTSQRTFYVRDLAGNVLTELTVPPRKYDEYYQRDYFYALGRVIGMAEERAPSPVQGISTSAAYSPGFPEEEIPASGSVTVTWTLNPSTESIAAYRVWRKDSPTGVWVQKGGDRPPTSTAFTENSGPGGVAPGSTYYYRVAAVNTAGLEGIPSRILKVVVSSPPALATPPTPTLEKRLRGLTVRWQRSSDDVVQTLADGTPDSIIQGYHVYRKDGAGSWVKKNLIALTDTVFHDLDPNLSPTVNYQYQIRALSTRGTESAGSLAVTGSPGDYDPPATPTGVIALPGPLQDQVTVAWNPSAEPDLQGYKVYHKISGSYVPIDQPGAGTTSYTVSGITSDEVQYFSVSARDATSESALSIDVEAQRRHAGLLPPVLLENYPFHFIDLQNTAFLRFWWDHPAGSRVRIYRKLEHEPWHAYQPVFSNSGSYYLEDYLDQSFDWCRAYTYQLRAFDLATGREGADPSDPNLLTYTAERVISPTTPTHTGNGANSITLNWTGIDHCSELGNGFEIRGWVVHTSMANRNDQDNLPLLPSSTRTWTKTDAQPGVKYGFALRAKIRNLHKYNKNPADPTAEFWSVISLDVCTNVLGENWKDHPDCADISNDNPSGGGGGGPPDDRVPTLLRLIRPGPGASSTLLFETDGNAIAAMRDQPTLAEPIQDSKTDDTMELETMAAHSYAHDGASSLSQHRLIGAPSPKQFSYSFFHTDHLGSPRLVTGPNGEEVARQKFLPFGEEIPTFGSSSSTHKFTGHERDVESSIDYMRARSYCNRTHRFLQVDPVTRTLTHPHLMNRYGYVGSNPLAYIDPDGRATRSMHYQLSMNSGLSSTAAWGVANVDKYGPLPDATFNPDGHSLGKPGMLVAKEVVNGAITSARNGDMAAAGRQLKQAIHAAQDDAFHRDANGKQLNRATHCFRGDVPTDAKMKDAAANTAKVINKFEQEAGLSATSVIEADCAAGGDCRSESQIAQDVSNGWNQFDVDFGRSLPSPDNPTSAVADLQGQGFSVKMNGADMTPVAGKRINPSGTSSQGLYGSTISHGR